MKSKHLILLPVFLVLFYLADSSVSEAATHQWVIKDHRESYEWIIPNDELTHSNMEPGLSLPQATILIHNQTEATWFQLSILKDRSQHWLEEHLQGTITIDGTVYSLNQLEKGTKVLLPNQSKHILQTNFYLSGIDMPNTTQELSGEIRFRFYLLQMDKSSLIPTAASHNKQPVGYPILPRTGEKPFWWLIRIGIILLLALLVFKKTIHLHNEKQKLE